MGKRHPVFRSHLFSVTVLGASLLASAAVAYAEEEPPAEVVISVADQKMALLREGQIVARYPISTSKFGVGDGGGSYKTPLGHLRVCEKLGGTLPVGTVIKHRMATNEVLAPNAPGRDPIVTRILWLDGCEGQNANAKCRSIYIHGTPEEKRIGQPVSYGCIRMKSEDVVSLYNVLPVGASVTIVPEKLPHYAKYVPKPATETLLAVNKLEKAKPLPAPIVPMPPKPPAIAAMEQQLPPTRRATVEPVLATVPPKKPSEVLNIVATNRVTATSTSHELLRGSMIMSGLGDGNSEIPQLRRDVAQR